MEAINNVFFKHHKGSDVSTDPQQERDFVDIEMGIAIDMRHLLYEALQQLQAPTSQFTRLELA